MDSEFIKEIFITQRLIGFLLDVGRIVLGVAIGGYVALRLARRKGED